MSGSSNRWLQYLDALVGVSVVLTLIVLIVEVRSNSVMIERQILSERAANIVAPLIVETELLSAYAKIKTKDGWEGEIQGLMDTYGLEPAEAVSWSRMLLAVWWGIEIEFLTSGPSNELDQSIRGLLEYPDNRLYWSLSRDGFDPEFRSYVDRSFETAVAEPEAGSSG